MRKTDGLILSWDGPIGFQYSLEAEYVFQATRISDNTIIKLPSFGVPDGFLDLTVPYSWLQDSTGFIDEKISVYLQTFWSTTLYAHGKAISTPSATESGYTSGVMGACVLDDTIVIICSDTRNSDRVYYSKYSELLDFGWKVAGDINHSIPTNADILTRNSVFAFDSLSTKFVGLATLVINDDSSKGVFKKNIVRGNISINNGVVSVTGVSSQIHNHSGVKTSTRTRTNTETSSTDILNSGGAVVRTEKTFLATSDSQSDTVIDKIHAVGFNATDIEVSLTSSGTVTETSSDTSNIIFPDFNNGVDDGSQIGSRTISGSIDYFLDGVLLYSNSEVESTTINISQGFSLIHQETAPIFLNYAEVSPNRTTTQNDLLHLDIANTTGAYLHTVLDSPLSVNVSGLDALGVGTNTTVNNRLRVSSVLLLDGTVVQDIYNDTFAGGSVTSFDAFSGLNPGDPFDIQQFDNSTFFSESITRDFDTTITRNVTITASTTEDGSLWGTLIIVDDHGVNDTPVNIPAEIKVIPIAPSNVDIGVLFNLVGTNNSLASDYTELTPQGNVPLSGVNPFYTIVRI